MGELVRYGKEWYIVTTGRITKISMIIALPIYGMEGI